ncbi:MAG TPA: MaoC family dehydratase [Ktedonobacterales bacterium]|nr:MaoC family dehydratase [Ktedonobacterales bacterium]
MSEAIREATQLPPVGASAQRTRVISEDDVALFAQVSGDENPVHLDKDYAALSPFQGRIAHGLLTASLISAVLGNDLPGHGSIYLNQTLKFLAPVRIGDTITARVEVVATREEKRLVTLRTDCLNQEGALVLTGEALIKYLGD